MRLPIHYGAGAAIRAEVPSFRGNPITDHAWGLIRYGARHAA